MKRVIILLLCLTSTLFVFAQNESLNSKKEMITTGMEVFTSIWQDVPTGISAKSINIGSNYFVTYNSTLGKEGKSPMSFAIGIGLGNENFNSNALVMTDSLKISYLDKIPDSVSIGDVLHKVNYKKSKLSMTYFDFPMELRYKSKNDFRMALGFKIGFLLSSHTKYKGDEYVDFNKNEIFESYTTKINKIRNLETMRYGASFQIGYKWVNLMGYYSLSKLFKKDKGPQMYPISVGISLRPF